MKISLIVSLFVCIFSVTAFAAEAEKPAEEAKACDTQLLPKKAKPPGKITKGFVDTREGLPIYYQLAQTRKKVNRGLVVIANGLEYDLGNYDALVMGLNSFGYDVLVYAHRAQHQSLEEAKARDIKIGEFNVANLAADLEDLLEGLSITRAFHLASLSYGSAAAAEYAKNHPDRVKTLSLMAPLISIPVLYSSYREMQSLFPIFNLFNPFAESMTSPYERMQSAVTDFDLNSYQFEIPTALFLAEKEQALLAQQQAKFWERTLQPQGGSMHKIAGSNHSIPTSALLEFAKAFVPFIIEHSGQ